MLNFCWYQKFLTEVLDLFSDSALKATPKELSLFGYQLCVNKADKVHQPIELPDGTVQWLPGKRFFKDSGEPVCEKLVRSSCLSVLINHCCLFLS